MFLLNSRLGLFSAACSQAPLILKLRDHFAEFLNNISPDGLRILSSSTCVGLRYGHLINPYSFSRQCTITCFATYFRSLSPHSTNGGVRLCSCVPVLNNFGGYGIFTVCASTTPSGLALAPDYLEADEPSFKNLRLSAIMILT